MRTSMYQRYGNTVWLVAVMLVLCLGPAMVSAQNSMDVSGTGNRTLMKGQTLAATPAKSIPGPLEGSNGLVIIVNKNNPIKELTLEQLRAVLSGKLKCWSALGGPVIPITVCITDPEHEGASGFLKKAVLKGADFGSPLILSGYRPVLRIVKDQPGAIAVCPSATAHSAGSVKVVALKKN